MHQYHQLMSDVLHNGIHQMNRTGVGARTLPGAMLKFDLREGFPAITTKKLAFNAVKGELIGFLRGCDNVKHFQDLGCKVWDANAEAAYWLANPNHSGIEGDLGRIYGVQWRGWASSIGHIDQLAGALDKVRNDPTNRRIIVTAWNPAELNQMALPPCHMLFQLLPHAETRVLHMVMYQRSCDLFLGIPFNIASYALLLELFARWTGYQAGTLSMMLADCHIYDTHVEQVKEQLQRAAYPAPKLWIHSNQDDPTASLNDLLARLDPSSIGLEDYQHHPALTAPMAV